MIFTSDDLKLGDDRLSCENSFIMLGCSKAPSISLQLWRMFFYYFFDVSFPPFFSLNYLDFGSPADRIIFSHFPALFLCLSFCIFCIKPIFSSTHYVFLSALTFLMSRCSSFFYKLSFCFAVAISPLIMATNWNLGEVLFCFLLWMVSKLTFLSSFLPLSLVHSFSFPPFLSLFLLDCHFSLCLPCWDMSLRSGWTSRREARNCG